MAAVCSPGPSGPSLALGDVWLDNTDTDRVAVLKSVKVGNDTDRPLPTVAGSFVIPHESQQVLGVGIRVPPDSTDPELVSQWALRHDLAGWQVAPNGGVNVVLLLRPEGARDNSMSEWFEITYTVGDHTYTSRSYSGIDFGPKPEDC